MNMRWHRPLIAVLAFLASVIALGVAKPAQALEFGFDIGSQSLHNYSESGLAWDSDQSFGGFGMRAELGLKPEWRVGFGWHTSGSGDGELHQYGTKVVRHDLTVDARYRYLLTDWLVPYGRLGLGPSKNTYTLSSWEGTAWTAQVQAGLGIELLIPRTAWDKEASSMLPAFGVYAEFGWQHLFAHDVFLSRTSPLEPAVAVADLHLGSVFLDGLLWRFGVAARF